MATIALDVRATAAKLRDDNRGAVMLTGLFMAFFLVGALWYVIGVGDAIIFRDRMQEAADSAVFSSAAIHAKGMNFISVCNIIMLIMAMIHIVFGIIQDLTIITCLAAGIGCIPCALACPKIPSAISAFHRVARIMKQGMTITSNVGSAIALAAPWAGSARGFAVAREYGNQGRVQNVNVFTLGTSSIPGLAGGRGILVNRSIPLGLPVKGEPYNMLCEKVGKDLFGFFGNLIPIPYFDRIMDLIGGAVGSFLKFRYCNDLGQSAGTADIINRQRGRLRDARDEVETGRRQTEANNERIRRQGGQGSQGGQLGLPGIADANPGAGADIDTTTRGGRRDDSQPINGWSPWFDPGFDRGWGDPGVLVVDAAAGNGTVAHQIWAVALNPKYRETNERKVSIAGSLGRGGRAVTGDSDQGSGAFGYFAQAEFYYDCGEEWTHDECDSYDDHNSAFGINWRARLRGLEMPGLFSMLARFATNGVRGVIENVMERAVQGNPVAQALSRSGAGAVAIDTLAGAIDEYVVGPLITDRITGAIDNFAAGLNPTLNGSYH